MCIELFSLAFQVIHDMCATRQLKKRRSPCCATICMTTPLHLIDLMTLTTLNLGNNRDCPGKAGIETAVKFHCTTTCTGAEGENSELCIASKEEESILEKESSVVRKTHIRLLFMFLGRHTLRACTHPQEEKQEKALNEVVRILSHLSTPLIDYMIENSEG